MCLALDHPAKGEIDPWLRHLQTLGNLVLPKTLGRAPHHQKTAVLQQNRNLLSGPIVTKIKPPRRPEAHRGNIRVSPQTFLVIMVPSHPLASVAIEIQETGIVSRTRKPLDHLFNFPKLGRPNQGRPRTTRIGLVVISIAIPRHLSRRHNVLPKHLRLVMTPGNFSQQNLKIPVRLLSFKDHPMIHRLSILWQNIARQRFFSEIKRQTGCLIGHHHFYS